MRSKIYCALSSLTFLVGCFAGEPKPDTPTVEVRFADFKENHKSDKTVAVTVKEDGEVLNAMGTGDPLFNLIPCPEGQGRMKNGDCATEEEFFGEQEALDADVLSDLQGVEDVAALAKAEKQFIQQQIRQTEQAEKNLDEIIRELKKKKSKASDGKKEGGAL